MFLFKIIYLKYLLETNFFLSDGLFPKIASKIHYKYKTPYITTAITGSVCAIASALLPIEVLAELTSVGTLLAFLLVNLGVMVLRLHAPDTPRKFKAPGGPYIVPITGALLALLLLVTATKASIERLFIWMAIGLIIYFFYGRKHSKANNNKSNVNISKEEIIEVEVINTIDDSDVDSSTKRERRTII